MKAPKPQFLLFVHEDSITHICYFETFAKADLFANRFISKKSIHWHIRDLSTGKVVARWNYGFYENLKEQKQ